MRSILRRFGAWLVIAAGCTALAAAAQDLPTRVGRVAYIEGNVSIYQDPEFGWQQAYVNTPITSQNSLWTDDGSRAEMRVGGLALRAGDFTQLDVSHLDDDGIDATVQRGALAIRLRHFERGATYLFSTPQAQFRLLADGRYRLDADADGETSRLEVFSGFAVLQSADGDVRVNAGRAIVLDPAGYHFERVDRDGFDQWADARDRYWVERTVTRYVAPDITGYEELDAYGTWIDEPGYGALWMPTRVQSGWVPYREGRWAWVSPWGWTWIDNEPWGYAPFHYGRWVQVRERWCWYPGRRIDRQAWAPALVGWIGGSGFSVTVSSGASTPALGWYPLAPEEHFHPWYRASNTYVNRVNVIVNNVTVNNVTINRGGPPPREVNRIQAATVVPRETLLQQRPVAQNVVHVAPQVVQQAPAAQPASVLPSRNDFARERPPQRAPGAHDRGPQDQRAAAPAAGGSLAATPSQGARPPEHPFARPAARPAPQAAAPNAPAANPFARPAPVPQSRAQAQPQSQPQAQPAAPAPNPFARTERGNREQREAPHGAAPTQAQPQPQPQTQPQPAPAAPAANPFARPGEHDNRGGRGIPPVAPQAAPAAPAAPQAVDRQREQQQQERAAREAQQRAGEQQRQQQQQQERGAREAQQRAAEQQRQQQQQQQQQDRAAREAQQRAAEQQRQQQQQQQQQERAAREAQQRAAEQQRQQQLQQQQQERAAREAQQRAAEQQRALQQQQQAQQRAAEQQQRALQQQQDRAAREAQRPSAPEKNEKKDDHGSGG